MSMSNKVKSNITNNLLGMNKSKNEVKEIQPKENEKPAPVSNINIDDLFPQVEEKKGKNKTFYLEHDVMVSIKKTAKSKKVSESKLVNDILKHVLTNK